MLSKWFDPVITWLIGRNLWEVKVWINQLPERPAIQTDLNFSSNFWIKTRVALYKSIKMVHEQQDHFRISCKNLELWRIEIIPRIGITLFPVYRMSDIDLHTGDFLTEHHAPGEMVTFFMPVCHSRIKQVTERQNKMNCSIKSNKQEQYSGNYCCLLYTSPSPRD